jgi:predicted small lipoprotein YifL
MKGEVVIMIKRIIAILIAVILLFSLVGCGARKKVDQKIQEKVMEKTVDKITGDNVDIDTDKDKITIKGKDGNEEFTFGDSKWPEGKAADLIPKFKKGNIVSVMNADSACVIMIENVQENDFKQYMEEVKKAGFTKDVAEHSSTVGFGYLASSDNGRISIAYSPEEKSLSITIEKNE